MCLAKTLAKQNPLKILVEKKKSKVQENRSGAF